MGKIKNLLIEAMETPIMDACSECQGSGMVEVDVVRPHGFGRDVGVIDGVSLDVAESAADRLCRLYDAVLEKKGFDDE